MIGKGSHDVILSACLIVAVLQASLQYAMDIRVKRKVDFETHLPKGS